MTSFRDSLSRTFDDALKRYECARPAAQTDCSPVLQDAIAAINASGDFTARLVLAQSGAVSLYARKTGWREDRLVTLAESDLAAARDADAMAVLIVAELAHTLARAQRAAQVKWLLG
jgi:hypothetical protein